MMSRIIFLLRLACLALCFALFAPSACVADTYFVSPSGSDSNPGTALKPFLTLSQAVNSASDTDTITVADGTYTGAKNRDVDFAGVDLKIKSASGNPANCVIDCQKLGCAFILQNNQTTNSAISGFTIRNGTGFTGNGGGIYISNGDTNPTVNNCVFTGNSAQNNGGGLYYGTATNCVFTGNTAGSYGGGTYYTNTTNCVFTGNYAYDGGGMLNGTAINCVFTGNSAAYGGGMDGGTATNCVFTGNTAGSYGGGTYSTNTTNCVFTGNSAASGGGLCYGTANNCAFTGNTSLNGAGGMYGGTANNCVFNGNLANFAGGMYGGTANNCVFTGNLATNSGGGIQTTTATNCVLFGNTVKSGSGGGAYSSSLYFCTAAGNYAGQSGGGVYMDSTSNTITNCIVYGNTSGASAPNLVGPGTVTYSDIQRGFTGTGNITSNPQYVSQSTGNLHLSATSPCINAGTSSVPSGFTFPTTDRDGGKRIISSNPDMGAYETGNIGVFGAINFFGIVPAALPQIVTFQFRPVVGGATIGQTYYTTSDGAFYLYGVPNGNYNLWIKSPTYLATLVPVTVSGGAASVTATLQPGDCNNDNACDTTDFGIFVSAYNTSNSIPGSGYDLRADLNGDGSVDATDFGLFVGSYNTQGDP